MASRERIVVVGAGIIGCAVAFELSKHGVEVAIFEAGEVGGGATQASAGILAPYTEAHAGGRLFELTVRGLAAYDEFVAAVREISPVPFEYRRAGTIEVAEDAGRARALKARADGTVLQWVDQADLRQIAPAVAPQALGGLFCPLHAHVAVRAFVSAIADASQRLGVRIQSCTRVDGIRLDGGGVTVRSGAADHAFDRAILCAGAWTPALDIFGVARGRINPVRGQLVRLRAGAGDIRQVLWSRSCYLVPWQDGTVLVGATSENAGFDLRATAGGVRDLLAAACELAPGLASATFQDVLVGLRPASTEGVPILGPAEDPRVLYAAGHYRNGILLAPLTARLIAGYLLENTTDPAFSTT